MKVSVLWSIFGVLASARVLRAKIVCPPDISEEYTGRPQRILWNPPTISGSDKSLHLEYHVSKVLVESENVVRNDLANNTFWESGRYQVVYGSDEADTSPQDSCKFRVAILDTTPPRVDCPTGQLRDFANPGHAFGAFTFDLYAVDNIDGDISNALKCLASPTNDDGDVTGDRFLFGPNERTEFPAGLRHDITCVVKDSSENSAACSFSLTVLPFDRKLGVFATGDTTGSSITAPPQPQEDPVPTGPPVSAEPGSNEADPTTRADTTQVDPVTQAGPMTRADPTTQTPTTTQTPHDYDLEDLSRGGVESIGSTMDKFESDVLITNETETTAVFLIVMDSEEAREIFKQTGLAAPVRAPIDTVVFNDFDASVSAVVLRIDQQQQSPEPATDRSALALQMKSYVSVVVQKFDSVGGYIDSQTTFTICLGTNKGKVDAAILVYRKGIDESKFAPVTNVVRSAGSPGCFAITSKTSTFLIADVTGEENFPQYARRWSASETYFEDSLDSYGCERTMSGGIGTNCEDRLCPYGLTPTANSYAPNEDATFTPFASSSQDIDGGMHTYSECSSSGVCDRSIGTCQCNDDREGAACERNKCPNSCNFNGLCKTMAVVQGEIIDVDSFYGTNVGWNSLTYQQCVCDPGFFGGDCSLRTCPKGVNPFQICAENSNYDVQEVDLSQLDPSSSFVLEFTTATGMNFATHPLPQSATAGQIQRALERLPNAAIPAVQVSRDASDGVQITFADDSNLGRQETLSCNPDHLVSLCGSGTQPRFNADRSNPCPVSHIGAPETDATLGYFELSTCSDHGICNSGTGTCECFPGFYGFSCNKYAQIS